MKRILTFILPFLFLNVSFAQESWELESNIDFPRLGLISLDNQGFIFIADLEGNIYQYDRTGKEVNNFSPPRQGALISLEAARTANIFTFSIDLQEYRILDRFINPIAENRVPLDQITLAKSATLGNNNIIWFFDEADLSLKQFDFRIRKVQQQQPLNLILNQSSLDIRDMREYQNLLFLNIRNEGIYILDNQANMIKHLPVMLEQKFSFWKNFLVYVSDGNINLQNFMTGKMETVPLPENITVKEVLINQYNVILSDGRNIFIYPKSKSPLKDF
ncbi:hypothetical protein [Cecembia calidifontis]|jgi:hypothetical protein|uniref:Uncharacterized protein n=1 Tax=Cecembia calidifontis TaxID=1187080 RepID=A0A4Q7P926_9BACT|nr:hypothetical protein [Cecembia calidifontis]RZS96644.1 hypothetical protein BC751_2225 [Cecembia calidifontis]